MKKMLVMGLAACMAVSMAACGSTSSTTTTSSSSSSDTAASTEATAAEETSTETAAADIDSVWPEGTNVTVIVPAKAGGGTDLYTRYVTEALGELCPGVNFVVNNIEGESGMQQGAHADADGLTLTACHGGAIIQYLCGSSDTNIDGTDLAVVGIMNAGGPQAIIASPDAPYDNLVEWGEWVVENPGECVVGCSLGGASQVVLYSTLDAATDGHADDVNYVQCASEADKLTQTASKAIDIANCSVPNAQAYEADGKLKILGVVGPSSCTLENMSELVGLDLPDTFATSQEQGLDFSYDSNYYLCVPAGTPEEIQEAINSVLYEVPTVQSYIDGMNTMATYTVQADLATSRQMLADEWTMQDETVTKMGLKVR